MLPHIRVSVYHRAIYYTIKLMNIIIIREIFGTESIYFKYKCSCQSYTKDYYFELLSSF